MGATPNIRRTSSKPGRSRRSNSATPSSQPRSSRYSGRRRLHAVKIRVVADLVFLERVDDVGPPAAFQLASLFADDLERAADVLLRQEFGDVQGGIVASRQDIILRVEPEDDINRRCASPCHREEQPDDDEHQQPGAAKAAGSEHGLVISRSRFAKQNGRTYPRFYPNHERANNRRGNFSSEGPRTRPLLRWPRRSRAIACLRQLGKQAAQRQPLEPRVARRSLAGCRRFRHVGVDPAVALAKDC